MPRLRQVSHDGLKLANYRKLSQSEFVVEGELSALNVARLARCVQS